jgi:hypothetical protein
VRVVYEAAAATGEVMGLEHERQRAQAWAGSRAALAAAGAARAAERAALLADFASERPLLQRRGEECARERAEATERAVRAERAAEVEAIEAAAASVVEQHRADHAAERLATAQFEKELREEAVLQLQAGHARERQEASEGAAAAAAAAAAEARAALHAVVSERDAGHAAELTMQLQQQAVTYQRAMEELYTEQKKAEAGVHSAYKQQQEGTLLAMEAAHAAALQQVQEISGEQLELTVGMAAKEKGRALAEKEAAHAAAMAETRLAHAAAVGEAQEAHAAAAAEAQEAHAAAVGEAQEAHAAAAAEAQEAHAAAVAETEEATRGQLETQEVTYKRAMEEVYVDQKRQAGETVLAAREAHAAELQEAVDGYETKLAQRGLEAKQVLSERTSAHAEALQEHVTMHSRELHAAGAKHSHAQTAMELQHQESHAEAAETHARARREQQDAHREQIQANIAAVDAQICALRDTHAQVPTCLPSYLPLPSYCSATALGYCPVGRSLPSCQSAAVPSGLTSALIASCGRGSLRARAGHGADAGRARRRARPGRGACGGGAGGAGDERAGLAGARRRHPEGRGAQGRGGAEAHTRRGPGQEPVHSAQGPQYVPQPVPGAGEDGGAAPGAAFGTRGPGGAEPVSAEPAAEGAGGHLVGRVRRRQPGRTQQPGQQRRPRKRRRAGKGGERGGRRARRDHPAGTSAHPAPPVQPGARSEDTSG